ncbi:MAG: IS1595 family transposase [Planctomycetota bacterium]
MARLEFPRTLREFRERFAGENECCEYLIRSRWPEGMACPRCQGRQFWRRTKRWLHQCKACGFEVSPTAGTLPQDSHMPIREWFWTAYLVATHTPGLSAKRLQRQLGCSYKTAWYMLHAVCSPGIASRGPPQ